LFATAKAGWNAGWLQKHLPCALRPPPEAPGHCTGPEAGCPFTGAGAQWTRPCPLSYSACLITGMWPTSLPRRTVKATLVLENDRACGLRW